MSKVKKDEPGLPQLQRIFFINKSIRQGNKLGVADVMRYANISKESVLRDIKFMQNELKAPIAYSTKQKSYIYTAEFNAFDFADEKILLLYILVKQLSTSHSYMPFSEQDILERVKTNISGDYFKIIDKISYEVSEYEPVNYSLFSIIIQSLLKKHQLSFPYSDAQGEVKQRKAEPLKILHYNGKWYMLAWSVESEGIRLFLLSRMESGVCLTDKEFINTISDTEADLFINNSFGIFKNDEQKTAKIRFYEPVALNIRRQIWHKDQIVRESENASGKFVDFELPVGGFGEIIGRVLRYGTFAEILEPQDLRLEWLKVIGDMWQKFGK